MGDEEKLGDPVQVDKDDFNIHVIFSGKTTTLFVHAVLSIEHVKAWITLKTGLLQAKHILRFKYNVIRDLMTLVEWGIGKDATIYMEADRICNDFVFQICITMPYCVNLPLDG